MRLDRRLCVALKSLGQSSRWTVDSYVALEGPSRLSLMAVKSTEEHWITPIGCSKHTRQGEGIQEADSNRHDVHVVGEDSRF